MHHMHYNEFETISEEYEGKTKHFLVLKSNIEKDGIQIITETCPFCQKKHFHGSGGIETGKKPDIYNAIWTWGHRIKHCNVRNVSFTLRNGITVNNEDGYFLGWSENGKLIREV